MQINHFTTGGFVIHKITVPENPNGRYSAWFDAEGNILDAEGYYNRRSGMYHVRRDGSRWQQLARMGKRHANTP